ncbi:hypothetical protein DFQ29_005767 [Apophysomyces sp. BC1021]|nr:hypothetical protein DFQ29_005767 [Apophysomyces sp. BC1021]
MANTATQDHIKPTKEQWNQCLDPGEEPTFYLSVVLVTRMDDYAGNQHHRLQNFIDSTYLLAEHTKEKIELLMVEWNPPKDKRRVIDTFRFRRSKYLKYRIITISKELHDVVPNIGNAPLHEFEGKNAGIRFARGEFVVCTNQDDIWSHNFHKAVKSRVFKKNFIYLQHQDHHNILDAQTYGEYELPEPYAVTPQNYLFVGDQAGDFTMAHRDTWKVPRGYRETGGVAWMDIEFIATATWTFDIPVVHSPRGFACHQEHANVWEAAKERHTNNSGIVAQEIMEKKTSYYNEDGKWGLQQYDIWGLGLGCVEFQGGLCW